MPLVPVNDSIGSPFIELQSIDSTNNYALAQIHANLAQPGTCYFAHNQTAGKGQRGKSWLSDPGSNLIMSIVLKPVFLQPLRQFDLSACIAVATHHFLSNYLDGKLKIKWPNDLYWNDCKLGGILIENVIGEERDDRPGPGVGRLNSPGSSRDPSQLRAWKWSVVGIGINVNQVTFPGELQSPASLKSITGNDFDTVHLARELCTTIEVFYKSLMAEGPHATLNLYNQFLYKRGQLARFRNRNRNFEAIVSSVSDYGQLIIHHEIDEKFDFGDIEWLTGI